MNRFITAIAIVTTLSIVQGCTQLAQVRDEPTTMATHSNTTHTEAHPTTHTTNQDEEDDHANTSPSTQANLTTTVEGTNCGDNLTVMVKSSRLIFG